MSSPSRDTVKRGPAEPRTAVREHHDVGQVARRALAHRFFRRELLGAGSALRQRLLLLWRFVRGDAESDSRLVAEKRRRIGLLVLEDIFEAEEPPGGGIERELNIVAFDRRMHLEFPGLKVADILQPVPVSSLSGVEVNGSAHPASLGVEVYRDVPHRGSGAGRVLLACDIRGRAGRRNTRARGDRWRGPLLHCVRQFVRQQSPPVGRARRVFVRPEDDVRSDGEARARTAWALAADASSACTRTRLKSWSKRGSK